MILTGIETTKKFKMAFANEFENNNNYTYFRSIEKNKELFETNKKFKEFSKIEKMHENHYTTLLNNLRRKKVFNRTTDIVRLCQTCGYVHIGADAPSICPICKNPESTFEIQ